MIWTTFATWYESKICLKNNIDAVLLTKKSSGQPFDHLSHQKCSWPYFNLRSFSPNYGKIPQFTGFVNKDWIVEKVAQKATIRNSVMQPCAAFHSRCVHALQGILLLSKWYTCCLRRNTHTHIHNFRNGGHIRAYIHIDVVSNGILSVGHILV